MGISERKEREREARRGSILDAAESVFKTKGFANSTMDDIARSAELAKGTVYLYYKSKEELQVGLMIRGSEILLDIFRESTRNEPTNFAKLLRIGQAYWQFATENPFYFALHLSDHLPANNTAQISNEMITSLHQGSSEIWKLLVEFIEGAKNEGMVRPEVDSFSVSMLLWLNGMGVLRMNNKMKAVPENVYSSKKEFNPCQVDFYEMYQLNGTIMMHEIVTAKGAESLGPIQWPQHTSRQMEQAVNCTQGGNISIGTYAEGVLTTEVFESGL